MSSAQERLGSDVDSGVLVTYREQSSGVGPARARAQITAAAGRQAAVHRTPGGGGGAEFSTDVRDTRRVRARVSAQ